MPLRIIHQIRECTPCLDSLSIAELQMLAQQQDRHMVRHHNRGEDSLPLI